MIRPRYNVNVCVCIEYGRTRERSGWSETSGWNIQTLRERAGGRERRRRRESKAACLLSLYFFFGLVWCTALAHTSGKVKVLGGPVA